MRRIFLVIALSVFPTLASCKLLVRGEASADGKITAGPVWVLGEEVAPKFDVVDGIATVVISSIPPFITVNLDSRAALAKEPDEKLAKAINEGRVAIFRQGARMGLRGVPFKASPAPVAAAAAPCPPVAAALPAPVCAASVCTPPPAKAEAPACPKAARAAAPCPPVYQAPHCLPKVDPSVFAGVNAFLCNLTSGTQRLLGVAAK